MGELLARYTMKEANYFALLEALAPPGQYDTPPSSTAATRRTDRLKVVWLEGDVGDVNQPLCSLHATGQCVIRTGTQWLRACMNSANACGALCIATMR